MQRGLGNTRFSKEMDHAILEGIRVLDWTIYQTGPMATAMLGDLGAEVIKIEDNLQGDPSRAQKSVRGVPTQLAGGTTPSFEIFNRNKKSIAVDLSQKDGREIVTRLIEKSDVFVQNFRPGVAQKLGLDYATLSNINSRLVYASASGFGPNGPRRKEPAFDPLGQASSGMMWGIGDDDCEPMLIPGAFADQITASFLAYGIVLGLLARERLGIGQEVNGSLLASMMWVQANNFMATLLLGRSIPGQSRAKARNPLWNHYRCGDNRWIMLAGFQSDRYWRSVCRALNLHAMAEDPRFDDIEKRDQQCEEIIREFDRAFQSASCNEWLERLRAAGDVPCCPVLHHNEVVKDPQVLANNYIFDFAHPVFGDIKMPSYPVQLSKTPPRVMLPAPTYGQHTEEVLLEIANYSWPDIERLKEKKVII